MLQYFLPLLLASVVSARYHTLFVVANNSLTLQCEGNYRSLFWINGRQKVAEGSTVHNANYSVSFNDNSYYLTFTAVSESYHECKQRVDGGPPVTLAGYKINVADRVNAIANDTVRLFCSTGMVWTHANLRNVPLNQRVWVDNSGDGQYDLVINNAQPSDSNIYLCYSSSGIGAAVNKEAYAVFVSMGLTTPTTPSTPTPTTPSTLTPTTTTPITTATLAAFTRVINDATTAQPVPVQLITALVCGGALLAVIGIGVAIVCCQLRRHPLLSPRNVELQEFIETV